MRPKHFSMLALTLSLLIIGLTAWGEFVFFQGGSGITPLPPIKPLAEVQVPPKSELDQMDFLERRMHLLSSPPPQMQQRADLSAFGYVPLVAGGSALGVKEAADKASSDHRLSMAFDGRIKRYCVIDDGLYAEGAVLPDGATIVKIESRRVLIAKENMRQWLDIVLIPAAETPKES